MKIRTWLAVAAAMIFTFTAIHAQALMITPEDCGVTIPCEEPGGPSQAVIDAYITANYPSVAELYKQDVGAPGDVGPLAGSYETTFDNTPGDPSEATITYIGGDIVNCDTEDCFLLVKDGNQDPPSILFNLTGIWDGEETLELKNFWPQQGAISHVTFYGGSTSVPEPSTLMLMGIGMIGLVGLRSRKKI